MAEFDTPVEVPKRRPTDAEIEEAIKDHAEVEFGSRPESVRKDLWIESPIATEEKSVVSYAIDEDTTGSFEMDWFDN